ncbi:hypothetical protein LZ318_31910 [Saccharopolyspora indica]|uniref:hypothetical protein n=1 Tax=Saccharopolyspora indica TaxID=1229659 RepID=UPI0022EAC0E9|nr:hypothetical protein [Saccharopolyspora indica]MDA3644156.1 hypothetical protein [Saccharopolyspora indica]
MQNFESDSVTIDRQAGAIDPEYFALQIRRAFGTEAGPEGYMDDPLADVADPGQDELLAEFASLATHPEVVAAGLAVTEAEAAVMEAEDASVTDELAMRRLDKARAAERQVLVTLQRRRAMAHTERAVTRVAQVVPMRRFAVLEGGAAA